MKQTDSINRNKREIDRFKIMKYRQIQLIAINMKQTDSINRNMKNN